jgi:hypothetical protein
MQGSVGWWMKLIFGQRALNLGSALSKDRLKSACSDSRPDLNGESEKFLID